MRKDRWPTAEELFATLMGGGNSKEWSQQLVVAIKRETGSDAAVFEDRSDTSSRVAGAYPSKTILKDEHTISACGVDESGFFLIKLRVVISGVSVPVASRIKELSDDSLQILAAQMLKQSVRAAASLSEQTSDASSSSPPSHGSRRTRTGQTLKYGIFIAGDATREVINKIDTYGPSKAPVLILGPTGTGKERVAQALHQASGRRGSLVCVNCAALPPDLVSSELFGYKKGSFTGATADKKGLVECAEDGTLFLDEIGDMPLSDQAALLRVLNEGAVRPLGSHRELPVNFRLVAATHQNLLDLVRRGKFREDLYFRLNGVTVKLLPLAERRDEILPLAEYHLRALSSENGRVFTITDEAKGILCNLPWRGNVRELMRTLEAAALHARDSQTIDVDHLPVPTNSADDVPHSSRGKLLPFPQLFGGLLGSGPIPVQWTYNDLSDWCDRALVLFMLESSGWSVASAAAQFHIALDALQGRLEHHGISLPPAEDSQAMQQPTASVA